jgi:5-methyltetrahydrofolate--homocysteine methyltransferase
MAIGSGLTSAITNPMEPEIRSAIMAADVLTGNDTNAARWIRANREPVAEGAEGGRRVNARRRAPAPGAPAAGA